MFIADLQLQTEVAALQKLADGGAALTANSMTVIKSANAAAYGCIVRALIARGYTKAQVDAWDSGAEFQRSIGLYFYFVSPLSQTGEDAEVIKMLDRRKELKTEAVTNSYVLISPAPGQPGQVAVGAFDQSADMFVWPDPDDSRIGQISQV